VQTVTSRAPLLELTGIRAGYGDLQALFDISLEVRSGEIVTLIGANGAGRPPRCASSPARSAPRRKVRFDGHDITALPVHAMPERGISHVPEGRQLFPFMTVEENLDLGALQPAQPTARTRRARRGSRAVSAAPGAPRQLAGTLSGGEQQMVAIAAA